VSAAKCAHEHQDFQNITDALVGGWEASRFLGSLEQLGMQPTAHIVQVRLQIAHQQRMKYLPSVQQIEAADKDPA
jgi:hypothetical protein